MAKQALFMETTTVDATRTAAEIRIELLKAGATKIMEEYERGVVVGLTFSIPVDEGDLPFRLPVRVEPVFKVINGRRKYNSDRQTHAAKDRAQAVRVAWRQLYRWIQAQVALIQTGMVRTQEVFLPYLTNHHQTLYEVMEAGGFQKMLPALPAPKETA